LLVMMGWSFLTNGALVRLRDIVTTLSITERSAYAAVGLAARSCWVSIFGIDAGQQACRACRPMSGPMPQPCCSGGH
jgi:hypothetical protein